MDSMVIWYLALGFTLILIGMTSSLVDRMPLSTSMVYLAIGVCLGQHGLGVVSLSLITDARLFEFLTELVVIVSLFCAGLKLRLPIRDARWLAPVRLAVFSMAMTVGMIAAFAVYVLHFPWGAAILLGGILAPTDPVLASDVQVKSATDRDDLRFALTAEAGLNDGTAFPFVMLGLGLMGIYNLGTEGWHWVAYDWIAPTLGGLLIGGLLGKLISESVLFLRRRHEETAVLDDFLALGLIGLTYGTAQALHTYGFLAVFAAGLSMRAIEHNPRRKKFRANEADSPLGVLSFTEQMERLGEVFTVVFLGTMLNFRYFWTYDLWMVPVLLLVIRPASVFLGLLGVNMDRGQRSLIAWFGIRGIGSLYYLTFAFSKGIEIGIAERLAAIVFATVIISILVHGVSAFPFMHRYEDHKA